MRPVTLSSLINLFILIYLISIDWTSLWLSSKYVQKFSRDQLFFQFSQKLIIYYTILRKYWNHFTKSCRNQCLFLLHTIFLHTTADTWLTSHNLSELHEYACDLYQTCEYSEESAHFQCQFNHFLNASLSRAIAGADAEKKTFVLVSPVKATGCLVRTSYKCNECPSGRSNSDNLKAWERDCSVQLNTANRDWRSSSRRKKILGCSSSGW